MQPMCVMSSGLIATRGRRPVRVSVLVEQSN
eukprot:CAMPEP_0205856466 /NCGR_PEP_ID=MMETSP1083-20121108/3140_1 /ASSEMBLY_ACC=CAM_ASM_000430 /TAXON_ID=97485 /ORGANISM="Prymnesium parvum, Strain Texoma1" /LENGTH=30 /DNA_ID= /DNA_START= /DNA_END= /DNA_ORIENTATION=